MQMLPMPLYFVAFSHISFSPATLHSFPQRLLSHHFHDAPYLIAQHFFYR